MIEDSTTPPELEAMKAAMNWSIACVVQVVAIRLRVWLAISLLLTLCLRSMSPLMPPNAVARVIASRAQMGRKASA